ncbi:hypothetical protein BCR41DRAFT_373583 [Lobosporangium transversale]|uniref:Uncharacterized protein n=1 Tax=Lobosporangium transversale TaxID=64571 RepID=A0A1Y2GD38_9FUNG|nr:hypothetical protein BCR41DRAFT_373583 [Lobosporangium transversale]ORZ07496.1 hypothetical protein BCR41DRAFT_373583 [Lobosporangium transversale]|eukprot:XP_021878003.1 hypothetical protein BCR41DRAFT_373583 [Lobosporangium transversale]
MSNGLHLQPAGRCRLDGGLGPATGVSVDCSRVYGPGGAQPDHLHVVRPGLSASRQTGEESESKSLSQGQHAVLVWASPFSAHFLRPAELSIELVVLSCLVCLVLSRLSCLVSFVLSWQVRHQIETSAFKPSKQQPLAERSNSISTIPSQQHA